ncbi:DNA base-flipping protein [Methanimicrococcus stummii]|uniref:DNA base-flipping protein n=1 Tax=Methanimicrococcus stummii TaxID=3028294 RepID=A0AA96VBR7_9EURY|nr:MGMT family protein [Methanimicrococcus sp. Es2]WNY29275.1 DNA base-flipping protein [Methanimicrococcus sp. Es2]
MAEKKKDFQEKYQEVYLIVANIPPGKVATYGQIAMMIGGLTARQVGYAMKTAPSGLPAHRVVNSLGKLSPEYVFGSQELQRKALEKEGVTFTAAGNIQMRKHLWGNNF